eukprot:7392749-Alexandrium_andersonii.AAC.1
MSASLVGSEMCIRDRFREGLLRRFDAKHARCIRRILGIQSTYAAKLLGVRPVTNLEVLEKSPFPPARILIRRLQAKYMGHLLRRPQDDPIRNLVFDRHLGARTLGGPDRAG